ncbi:hypothetical protein GCM10008986_14510 [Salinibacillus aidingensis]|uniref:Uncharacterized protein n=1 Tax=Salinibacillus aidingensis TaxID=237684 RepID=A0ABP3KYZ2_9BACI
MLERLRRLGWKKLVLAAIAGTISLFALAFTLIFGLLLLMNQFDDRYFKSEEYKQEMQSSEMGAEWKEAGSLSQM